MEKKKEKKSHYGLMHVSGALTQRERWSKVVEDRG